MWEFVKIWKSMVGYVILCENMLESLRVSESFKSMWCLLYVVDFYKRWQALRVLESMTEYVRVCESRVYKSDIHTDAHMCKISHNLHKILPFEHKTVKVTSFNLVLLILMQFFCVLWPFRYIFMHNIFWLDILSAKWKSLLESLFAGGAHVKYQHLKKLPTCQLPNLIHVLLSILPQLINFHRKTGTSFWKFVKHCESFRCWEVEQVPHDLWKSFFKIFLRQTFELRFAFKKSLKKLSHKSVGPCSTSQHVLLLQCLC